MTESKTLQKGFAFNYKIPHTNTRARLGQIHTPHGVIETPAFIFCATKGAIKGLTPHQMQDAGTQIMLSNTYHMMLQPGARTVAELGGLHKMMGWSGPLLTDSGGYQIFSLGHGSVSDEIKGRRMQGQPRNRTLLNISENGATFRSYLDGTLHTLTPERSMRVQKALGADLVLVLDECTPFNVSKDYTARSMEMSHRWALRSLMEFKRITDGLQRLYGIVQGGVHEGLRDESVDFLNRNRFFGHAIGGSLGSDKEQMHYIVSYTAKKLDPARPIHLLGIGGIRDIFWGVEHGIDTFDCVHPTRLARHGGALIKGGDIDGKEHINLRNGRFKNESLPVEENCDCYTCSNFSRGYLHHLLKAGELVALTLLTIHNVRFMNRCMHAIRGAISKGNLQEVAKVWLPQH
jgi:queuine tRNA-ribosyltransferase